MTNTNYSRGDKLTYAREIQFKGTEETTATIVAIFPGMMGGIKTAGPCQRLLLDNGDEMIATPKNLFIINK